MIRINKQYGFSKVGMNEVEGLREAMNRAFQPIVDVLKDKMYWNSRSIVESVEYIGRDGFIPHRHNCGGLQIRSVIPDCEKYEFDFLEFGEWDGVHYCEKDKKDGDECECCYGADSEFDALMRIWFKFEGYDYETGELSFYLVLEGGNNDAPYFRDVPTLFEASFTCKSLEGLKKAASKHIKALLNIIK